MIRALALVLIVACVDDAPGTGTRWDCRAEVACGADVWQFAPQSVCRDPGDESVLDDWTMIVHETTDAITCPDKVVTVTCDVGGVCVR